MTNRLAQASSPYLLQHRHNPVHWQEWGSAALAEAEARNVPVLLSIGYAACHWCHVMAHESFEDAAIADGMNRGFVCIKVDREERPDIDHIYQQAWRGARSAGRLAADHVSRPPQQADSGGTYSRVPRYGPPASAGSSRSPRLWRDARDSWKRPRPAWPSLTGSGEVGAGRARPSPRSA